MEKLPNIEQIVYPEIAREIDSMAAVDQDMRGKNLENPEFWDSTIDEKNTERMKEIIAEIGWPTVSKVGFVASQNSWLLVQHADHDPVFQRACLELMKKESSSEINTVHVAMLADRVLLKETGFQRYGTQFKNEEGFFVPLPIEEPEDVEKRRLEMGLDTLQENLSRIYEKYRKSEEE